MESYEKIEKYITSKSFIVVDMETGRTLF